MPIYAYKCLKCHAEPEYIQKMSDPPETTCEACGGELVRKMTAAAFHLKGGGWYKDGYASSKPGDAGGGDAGGDKGGESKSGGSESTTKTETKSETKSESKPGSGAGAAA